jgi:hypothetical protein
VKSIITTVKKNFRNNKILSEGAKLQWKRLKSKGTVYKRATMSDLTKLKKSKSIELLDQKLIEVQKFKSTTLALKELKIGHKKLNSMLDKNILLEKKYYLKSLKK